MEYKNIDLEFHCKTATLWLNRPEKHNAFNAAMLEEIIHAFSVLKNKKIQLLVLRGRGPSFCSGADLKWLTQATNPAFEIAGLMSNCFQAVYNFPSPVIAMVHGNIMGGGMGFMCAADVVLAEKTSLFGFPEVLVGLAPAVVSLYALKRLTPSTAKLLMLTGKKISSKEALSYNLIDFSGEWAEMEDQLNSIINNIQETSSLAVEETKSLINKIYSLPVSAEAIELSINTFTTMKNGLDFIEGTKALFEKRKPNWKN